MRALLVLVIAVVLLVAPLHTLGEPSWQKIWEDTFDRQDVGSDWYLISGKASIVDGRLFLEGGGATILVERAFKPDVRFEFDAEADPNQPPCDLSAAIGANKYHGYAYLLAFGGQSNRVNQLLGPDVRQVDKKPPFVIEHGKKYHIVAQQEGKRLTYTVNGVKILDAVSTDLACGPGFDRIGLVTWAGMFVDNFRVYERSEPHPNTPIYPTRLPDTALYRNGRQLVVRDGATVTADVREAVDAFNHGELHEALALFRKVEDPIVSLVGEAYVIGDLGYEEKLQFQEGKQTADFKELADRFAKVAKTDHSNSELAAYAQVAAWLPDLIMSRSGRTNAVRLVALGPENNPFYYKARLYEARYHYWDGAEGGNNEMKQRAQSWMAELKKLWPENSVLRQYTGEQVPWAEELNADTSRHPVWAAYLREAYGRQIRIMERFFTCRQGPDGGLGGGYGDDCELMRTWMQIAAISSASETVRAGIERLSEGIWKNELKDGFSRSIGDVEHSAEPSADTLPTMLLIRYGDPLWVERNMRSCKTIRERFMGIDKKGYPRFKSAEFGADGVNTDPRAGGDTGYHARPMKHFIWQAWWGDLEAKDWFVRWCDGWRAATVARIGNKIPGYAPPTIWYPSGDINPPTGARWFDRGWNYYGDMGGMIHDSLLCAYYLTKDAKFLKPFQLAMDIATYGPYTWTQYPEGSEEAQRQGIAHMPDAQKTALYKWLTGECVYDEYTQRFAEPVYKYRINHDLAAFQSSFENAAKSQRYNLEFKTTEVLSTDRAALDSALTVFGAYTGAVTGLRDAATPTFAVTYDTPNNEFAALVTEATPKRLRVRLYSFHNEPVRMALKVWQLLPGVYILNQGELVAGEHPFQNRYTWIEPQKVNIRHRAEAIYINLPPQKEWVVDLRLDEPISVPKTAPDLAVHERDTKIVEKGLEITVHNIGNSKSSPVKAVLQVNKAGKWIDAGRALVPALLEPQGLTPSTKKVIIPVDAKLLKGNYRVVLDPTDEVYEICETNNSFEHNVAIMP